jgi:uncharacterized protein with FMN-binding domain
MSTFKKLPDMHYIKFQIFLICLLFITITSAQSSIERLLGNSQGRKDANHNSEIAVEVILNNSVIDSVNITKFNQNIGHKKYGAYLLSALDSIPKRIIKNQSLNVDVVSRATISSNAIILAAAVAILDSENKVLNDGKYNGSANTRNYGKFSGKVEVEVKVLNTIIDSISIIVFDQSIDHKKFGQLVSKARDIIPEQIINKQSIVVDGISGATQTSNAIKLAIARALENAKS